MLYTKKDKLYIDTINGDIHEVDAWNCILIDYNIINIKYINLYIEYCNKIKYNNYNKIDYNFLYDSIKTLKSSFLNKINK